MERSSARVNRIPGLDGLRAIAVSLVLAEHAAQRGAEWLPARVSGYLALSADNGVKIFFVLSGFLITTILIKEYANSGTISLRNFYLRRTLRIFPAAYVYLSVIGIGYLTGFIHIGGDSPSRILSPALYLSDYIPVWGWPLHHTWSLSVEEQFYLLWPPVFLVCRRKLVSSFPFILVITAVIFRCFAFNPYRFDTVSDSIAIGCLFAIFRPQLESYLLRAWPKRLPLSFIFLFYVVAFPASNVYSGHAIFAYVLGIPLFNVLVGFTILAVILKPPRWLVARPVIWLGRISYSLYLWQYPWVTIEKLGWLWLPGAVFSSWLSYRFVECPVLRWRDRKTKGGVEDAAPVLIGAS